MTHTVTPPGSTQDPPRPEIDPRFARRWVDARREEGRRRLRVATVVAAVLAVCLVAVGSLFSPLTQVRHIHVEVAGPTSVPKVIELSGLGHRSLMIHADPGHLERRLDAVAVLGGARVRRDWPDTVDISVETRVPVAAVSIGIGPVAGEWASVDATGRVLALSESAPHGVPFIYGAAGPAVVGSWLSRSPGPDVAVGTSGVDMNAAADSASVPSGITLALAVVDGLVPSIRSELVSATISPGGAVTLGVLPAYMAAGSISVDMGDGSQLAAKLEALAALLKGTTLSGVSSVDLSVPDRPTALTSS